MDYSPGVGESCHGYAAGLAADSEGLSVSLTPFAHEPVWCVQGLFSCSVSLNHLAWSNYKVLEAWQSISGWKSGQQCPAHPYSYHRWFKMCLENQKGVEQLHEQGKEHLPYSHLCASSFKPLFFFALLCPILTPVQPDLPLSFRTKFCPNNTRVV